MIKGDNYIWFHKPNSLILIFSNSQITSSDLFLFLPIVKSEGQFSRFLKNMKTILNFFDKLEDRIRSAFSAYPIIYAFVGGVAIVLFWKGVWDVAGTIPFLTGPVSIVVSVLALLLMGLFVSFFVGDNIIISGLKKERKVEEKIAAEVKTELEILNNIQNRLGDIEKELKTFKEEIK